MQCGNFWYQFVFFYVSLFFIFLMAYRVIQNEYYAVI